VMMRQGLRPSLVIAAMCVAEILSMTGYATFPAVSPAVARDWGLSAAVIGWIGSSYFAGTALGTLLLPAATDRFDARSIYLASLMPSTLGLLAFGLFAQGSAIAAAARFVQGFGLAGTYFPGLRALIAATPAAQHGRATVFYTSLYSVGTSLSFALSGVLDRCYGHAVTFTVLAAGPLLAVPLAAFALRSVPPPRRDPAVQPFQLGPILQDANVRAHAAAYAALCGQILVLQTWLVLLLVSAVPNRATLASTITAGITLCAVPASLFGDALAERHGRTRTIVAVMLASLSLLIVTFAAAGRPGWLIVGLALLLFGTTTMNSATITNSLRRSCTPGYLGRALSFYALAGAVGAMLAPFVFGLVLDTAGGPTRDAAWLWAACVTAALLVPGPLALLAPER
jgi:MFS family permease